MMMECGDNESALDVLSRAASFVKMVDSATAVATTAAHGEEPLSKSSSTSALRSSPSPVDLRNSPSSKELPTKSHKLRRNRERRELSLSFRKDRPKKYLSEETQVTTVNSREDEDSTDMVADRMDGEDGVASDVDDRRANGKRCVAADDDFEDEEDGDDEGDDRPMTDFERTSPVDYEECEATVDIEEQDVYDSPRTIMMMTIEDNDAPLDMTTGTRRNHERNSPTSSSTTPPLPATPIALLGHPSSPFRSNLRLLSGPFSPSAPPPPYHPLPNSAHQQHNFHHQRINTVQPLPNHHQQHRRRSSPPPPSSFLLPPPPLHQQSLVTNNSNTLATTLAHLQQRPSVITCASALMQQRSTTSMGSSSRSMGSLSFGHKTDAVPTMISKDHRTLSDPTPTPLVTSSTFSSSGKQRHGHRREILSGMCDPVIDEHFRRSLGKDYPEFLASSSASPSSSSSSPSPSSSSVATAASAIAPVKPANANGTSSNSGGLNGTSVCSSISISGMSVDDHFAKALGETWLRLQGKMTSSSCSTMSTAASSSSPPLSSSSPSLSGGSSSPVAVTGESLPPVPPPSPPIQQKQRHGVVSS